MPIYDVDGVTESDGEVIKILPRGVYPAEIISSEWGEVKKEGSKYIGATFLKLGFKVTDPVSEIAANAGDIIMLPFPDAMDADDIRKSLAKLKRLQVACNLEDMGDQIDNDLFLHCELQVEVSMKTSEEYGDQQTIRDYLAL
jgi:hypothetical protein